MEGMSFELSNVDKEGNSLKYVYILHTDCIFCVYTHPSWDSS